MRDRELKKYLQQSLQQETEHEKKLNEGHIKMLNEQNAKLEETIKSCIEIMREQKLALKSQEEPRTGFVRYLSDIFRFEGFSIFGLQAVTLFIICLIISKATDIPEYIPVFTPLFVFAVMPIMFKCQYYGMSEIEAVTRASGSQIVLAKLVLAGAANLVCMTFLISFEVYLQNSCSEIGRMILYCLVPYLVCMVSMLRLIRLRRRENIQICTVIVLGSCVGWGILAKNLPWLYEASAFGIWIVAFLFFATFFIKEIYFIVTTRREGKIYGVIN